MGVDILKKAKDYLIVCAVMIASIVIFIFKDNIVEIGKFGYIGVFFLCLLSNLTVFLPAPSLMVVVAYSQILSPVLVAIVGAIGTTIGELSGYMLGDSLENISTKWDKFIAWVGKRIKNVYVIVFVFALIPLPFFDFAGVYAGGKKVNLLWFFVACLIGKFMKMLFYTLLVGGMISEYINI